VLLVASFKFCKDSFVIGLPGSDDVIEDATKFVTGVLDGVDCPETSPLSTIVLAEERFVVVKRLTGHTKNLSDTIFSFQLWATNLPSGAGSVFGTEVQPGGKTGRRWKSDKSAPNSLKIV
jgi:hypothetical protein